MAKICPETGDVVLYVDCLECEKHGRCKDDKKKVRTDNAFWKKQKK